MSGVKKKIVTADLSSELDLKHRTDPKSSGICNIFSKLASNAPDLPTLCELRAQQKRGVPK